MMLTFLGRRSMPLLILSIALAVLERSMKMLREA
jgi:hypothetical protein